MRKMSDSGQSSAPTRVAGSTAGVCREQTIRALSLRSFALPPGPPCSRHTPAASWSAAAFGARHTPWMSFNRKETR
ncbi:MAG TPA: hypothetical protein PKI09_07600 [Dermatophilaceae bacterium]|nr:hypothetical protein [Dermatophilaceae bacterium]